MKALLFTTAVLSSIASMASAGEYKTNRFGDLIIPHGQQPPTAQQRRADPYLDRYPGLTPLERRTSNQDGVPTERPTVKSVCRSVWDGNSSATVCY